MDVTWDDTSGATLNPTAIRVANVEEIEYVKKMDLHTKVLINECVKTTYTQPIGVRWIDIYKGDADHPNCKSRLGREESTRGKNDDLLAATPPLEAFKAIIPTIPNCSKGEMIMINDVSRASFHAKAKPILFPLVFYEQREGKRKNVTADILTNSLSICFSVFFFFFFRLPGLERTTTKNNKQNTADIFTTSLPPLVLLIVFVFLTIAR